MRDAFWNVCKQLGSVVSRIVLHMTSPHIEDASCYAHKQLGNVVGRIVLHMTLPHMEGTSRLSCMQTAGECAGLHCTALDSTIQW